MELLCSKSKNGIENYEGKQCLALGVISKVIERGIRKDIQTVNEFIRVLSDKTPIEDIKAQKEVYDKRELYIILQDSKDSKDHAIEKYILDLLSVYPKITRRKPSLNRMLARMIPYYIVRNHTKRY